MVLILYKKCLYFFYINLVKVQTISSDHPLRLKKNLPLRLAIFAPRSLPLAVTTSASSVPGPSPASTRLGSAARVVPPVTLSVLHPKSFTKTCYEHYVYVLMHVIECVKKFL